MQQSLECLDSKRLFKQIVEADQIVSTLIGKSSAAWRNHPAVNMFRSSNPELQHGYTNWLRFYRNQAAIEWTEIRRGKIKVASVRIEGEILKPPWVGRADFHLSHRSNLLRKSSSSAELELRLLQNGINRVNTPIDLEYVWPTNE